MDGRTRPCRYSMENSASDKAWPGGDAHEDGPGSAAGGTLSRLALAGIVCGLVYVAGGFFVFPYLFRNSLDIPYFDLLADLVIPSIMFAPIAGVVLSLTAFLRIERSAGKLAGRALALWGFLLNILLVIFFFVIYPAIS